MRLTIVYASMGVMRGDLINTGHCIKPRQRSVHIDLTPAQVARAKPREGEEIANVFIEAAEVAESEPADDEC